ncbi:uncharacterized protein MYCFIDRAFT_171258 [Pseudocercospora fijiensis CIRAD86]|uniref:Heterokaryon incompatibility domain-containing protein n=1 Tax=Pseudocercospora fijiensis (strain CIRAD86) TaxID=383855 RepID=M3B7M9_PSEFD|nr:uncharacterized protein MYCFIDRAFT_171258 [Pseudocercospora fijiensis CIRAD86]EME85323.1 hypothetical protein MYCFIDRAFT_171258 [Pseudocercospora fijiensis CIRAD86]
MSNILRIYLPPHLGIEPRSPALGIQRMTSGNHSYQIVRTVKLGTNEDFDWMEDGVGIDVLVGSENEDADYFLPYMDPINGVIPTPPRLTSIMTIYRPLSSGTTIRLLCLLPGDHDEPVRIQLEPHQLGTTPYEATSYRWEGQPTAMMCDNAPLAIGKNAYDLLLVLRLRTPEQGRMLWMECVCINQQDTKEKEEQVKIMHLIYRGAKSVLIWLGLESAERHLAMALRIFPSLMPRSMYENPHSGNSVKTCFFDSLTENSSAWSLVQALSALFSRSWHRRIWMQQEAALCEDTFVLCGDDTESFSEDCSFVGNLSFTEAELNQRCDFITRETWKLLSDCSLCEATDPRDMSKIQFNGFCVTNFFYAYGYL